MENYNKKLFDKFMAGIAVVHVKTQDEYDAFMMMLEKKTDLKWAFGIKPTYSNRWTVYKEKTCIRRVSGIYTIAFGDTPNYERTGYEIIEFSDLMKKENKHEE